VAFAADRLFGDPARFHPVAGFGSVATRLERLLWRPSRTAGTLYATVLVASVAGATAAAERVLSPRARFVFRAAVVWTTLGGRSLELAARRLAAAVADGDIDEARRLAPALVGRDVNRLDGPELSRAAVESVAENTSDAVVAPLLWAALLGAPGAAAYRAVNTLDSMVGHRDERYLRFGWASAKLDDLVNWPAARLSALLAICAASERRATWRAAWIDGAEHPSPNAGRVEGAFAGALGLRLGGRNTYASGVEQRPFLGAGRLPAPHDVERAIILARVVAAGALVVSVAWSARP
jgi:adenosylcobinamide-phosphate synthase